MFKNKKAFTLIELLAVVIIVGALAVLTVTSLQKSRSSARDVNRIVDICQMQTALNLYFNEHQLYPEGPITPGDQIVSQSGNVFMSSAPAYPVPMGSVCDKKLMNLGKELNLSGIDLEEGYDFYGRSGNFPYIYIPVDLSDEKGGFVVSSGYSIIFCLEGNIEGLESGLLIATPRGIVPMR